MTTRFNQKVSVARLALLLLASVTCFAVSCEKRTTELPRVLSAPIDRLLPERSSLPASIERARIVGNLSPKDRLQITRLIGRIPETSHEIKSLEMFWDEYPLAARVRVDDYYVYCTRTRDGAWEISGSGSVITDSSSGMMQISGEGTANQRP